MFLGYFCTGITNPLLVFRNTVPLIRNLRFNEEVAATVAFLRNRPSPLNFSAFWVPGVFLHVGYGSDVSFVQYFTTYLKIAFRLTSRFGTEASLFCLQKHVTLGNMWMTLPLRHSVECDEKWNNSNVKRSGSKRGLWVHLLGEMGKEPPKRGQ